MEKKKFAKEGELKEVRSRKRKQEILLRQVSIMKEGREGWV